jgi:hypothetical protein
MEDGLPKPSTSMLTGEEARLPKTERSRNADFQLPCDPAFARLEAALSRSLANMSIQPPPSPWQNAVAPVASPPPLPDIPLPPEPVPAASSAASRASVHWLAWQRSDALEGYAIARPEPRQLEIAYWLASLLPFAAAFCAAPALPHMQFEGAPGWAQWMLCVAVLHIGFAAWLALMPDVSTIRVGTYLFSASAALYLTAMMAICFLSNSQLSAVGLSGLRSPAAAWCGLVFVVVSLTAGACGWIARHWQDAA